MPQEGTVLADENGQLANEKDISLIKGAFTDNESLLKSMRALFLGLEITQQEKEIIKKTLFE
mgnify:CR=1 FL=1